MIGCSDIATLERPSFELGKTNSPTGQLVSRTQYGEQLHPSRIHNNMVRQVTLIHSGGKNVVDFRLFLRMNGIANSKFNSLDKTSLMHQAMS